MWYDTVMAIRKPVLKSTLEDYIKQIEPLKQGFDFIDDQVVITDKNANILYANEAAWRMTGFSAQEMLGKNPADLWGGQMPRSFYEEMWKKIKRDKKPFVGEVRNMNKSGKEYWQEIHISPILDRRGDVKFFIAIEPNITDKKRKEKFREEFISILGHQSMAPITGIRWALNWIFERGGMDEEQKKALEVVYKQSGSLLNIISDLIFLSRLGVGHPENEDIDLVSIIKEIIKILEQDYPQTKFNFRGIDKALLYANRELVTQLFMSIISNAVLYSSQETLSRVDIFLDKKDGKFLFTCRDNGIGIPQRYQSKVFSKFFRAGNAVEINKTGTGLNLFIAKMIADNYGWDLSFKSLTSAQDEKGKNGRQESGKGTIFFVTI